ncbi:hypothetical protein AGMMS49587_10110 [Spirochaetia bacterium]|nr:hypothetical protein AGMMS49587_10110 [Spirochaetia bacterium]
MDSYYMISMNITKQWFTIARNDLFMAKYSYENMSPRCLSISCFHCQQAAEKALKGYLQYKGKDPPRIDTDDLGVLCRECMELDVSFCTVLEAASKLSPYGIDAWYPGGIVVDEKMTQTAIAQAQAVYDFALSKVPQKVSDAAMDEEE